MSYEFLCVYLDRHAVCDKQNRKRKQTIKESFPYIASGDRKMVVGRDWSKLCVI